MTYLRLLRRYDMRNVASNKFEVVNNILEEVLRQNFKDIVLSLWERKPDGLGRDVLLGCKAHEPHDHISHKLHTASLAQVVDKDAVRGVDGTPNVVDPLTGLLEPLLENSHIPLILCEDISIITARRK